MPAKRMQPPPPRRAPSPRRAATHQSSGFAAGIGGAGVGMPSVKVRYAGVAAEAWKLQDHRDGISDLKIALLGCADSFDNMKAREAQWNKITSNKGPGAIAVDALGFHARTLCAIDEEERRLDRIHSTMPEMSTVLAEIEQAKRDRALRQQTQLVQQQWAQTAGRTSAAPIGDAASFANRPPAQQMVNPYSVIPSQRPTAALFGKAPGGANGDGASPPLRANGVYSAAPPASPYPYSATPPSYSAQEQYPRPPTYSVANQMSYGSPQATPYPPLQTPPQSQPYGYSPAPPPPQQYPQYPQQRYPPQRNNTPGGMYQAL